MTNLKILNVNGNESIKYSKSEMSANQSMTLDMLNDMFKINPENTIKHAKQEWLSVLTAEGENLSLSDFISQIDEHNPEFLRIFDEELGHDILIATIYGHFGTMTPEYWHELEHIYNENLINKPVLSEQSNDGFINTQEIAKIHTDKYLKNKNIRKENDTSDWLRKALPVIHYCQKIKIKKDDSVYQGYVPSIAEMKIIGKYFDMINYLMNKICRYNCGNDININEICWTSTETTDDYIYAYDMHKGPVIVHKYEEYHVLPIFRKIDNI